MPEQRIKATKETAGEAMVSLLRLLKAIPKTKRAGLEGDIFNVSNFLSAARSKLPTNESYEADKARKLRWYHKGKKTK
jgi:hypothetical protein